MNIKIYDNKDYESYNRFIERHKNSSIYHTLEWKDIIQESYGYAPVYFCILYTSPSPRDVP